MELLLLLLAAAVLVGAGSGGSARPAGPQGDLDDAECREAARLQAEAARRARGR